MRLEKPLNPNYCATVVKISNIIPLEGCDNVVASSIFGFQVIISNKTKIGDKGFFFPAETQLSEGYCWANNLHRHSEKNCDPEAKGYFEDNRRVKAVKFRGHRSNAIFMPLSSVAGWCDPGDFVEGDEFDHLEGVKICEKYIVRGRGNGLKNAQMPKAFSRVELKFIPEHIDTNNYFKYSDRIPKLEPIVVTQKVHGTSIRIANTIVKRKPTTRDRIAAFFGAKIQDTEFDYVYASRRVIKDANNPNQAHYYDTDLWSNEGKKLVGLIPENFVVYGELIGHTDTGRAIQAGYTYNHPQKSCSLYIYRIAFVNAKGFLVDLTWDQLKKFCEERGLKYVPEVYRGQHKNFNVKKFLDKRLYPEFKNCVRLDDGDTVDEGVCIRVEGMTPAIYKAKSPIFLEHETKLLDSSTEDLEAEESVTPAENE